MKSPFPAGWWSFDLGRYRRCSGTYALYAYESVPTIDESQLTGVFRNYMTEADRPRTHRALARLVKAAGRLGVTLPAAFLTFMGDVSLQNEVPSCTACEWDLSAAPVACKVVPGAFTVRFLRDQQDCLFWYLHVLPDGDTHVLCSPIPFDEPAVVEKITPEVVIANTWYCAPHFEHFVYRFWIENVLWDLVNRADSALNEAQRAYLSHYEAAAAAAAAAKRQAKQADATKAAETRAEAKKTEAKKAAAKTEAKKAAAKMEAKKAVAKTADSKKTAAKKAAAKKSAVKKATTKAAADTTDAKKAAAKQVAAKQAGAGKGAKQATARRGAAVAKKGTRRGSTMKAARRSTAKKVTRVVA